MRVFTFEGVGAFRGSCMHFVHFFCINNSLSLLLLEGILFVDCVQVGIFYKLWNVLKLLKT